MEVDLGIEEDIQLADKVIFSNKVTHSCNVCPVVLNECKNAIEHTVHSQIKRHETVKGYEKIYGKLQDTEPVVPSVYNSTDDVSLARSKLHIYGYRQAILDALKNNQILIIIAETGSGKTSQVPQYILEEATCKQERCRIVCTQPKRFAAISAADRVTAERGETVGDSVAFHVRLESKTGFNSNLIYCTVDVLLRNLMCGYGSCFLKTVTHVIVDEIHERDKYSDVLLTAIRQMLYKHPSLKLILMSANEKSSSFKKYFRSGVVLNIPSAAYPIKSFFLEEVLSMTKYYTPQMKLYMANLKSKQALYTVQSGADDIDRCFDIYMQFFGMTHDYDLHFATAFDEIRKNIWTGRISVDYQHTENGMTGLMIAAKLGDKQFADDLCKMGANMNITCKTGKSAYDYAKSSSQDEILHLLDYYKSKDNIACDEDLQNLSELVTPELNEDIDYDLIVTVLCFIHKNQESGGILVFLPGFDEIKECYERILNSSLNANEYVMVFLHDTMYIKGQQEIFKETKGLRKIILSTNIAETYITIEDVSFVIDAGRRQEKLYDPNTEKTVVRNNWVSIACAKARERQAGKVKAGFCFKLYSSQRFKFMEEETLPEIMTCALEEMCLQIKNIVMRKFDIQTFFSMTPDPPNKLSIITAIKNLQTLGALTSKEEITPLGEYLSQLVIEPHLGKLLILGCIFKCLDPVLTLAAVMSEKDALFLPLQENCQNVINNRNRLAKNVLSDHIIYLKLFQTWQTEKIAGRSKLFYQQYGISESTMKVVLDNRRQLLGQLRAAGFVNNMRCVDGFNTYADYWGVVKAIMCDVFKKNLACPSSNGFSTITDRLVKIHKNSVCSNSSNFLFFEEIERNPTENLIKGVTAVPPVVMAIMCGDNSLYEKTVTVNDWLQFRVSHKLLLKFKAALQDMIAKSLLNPAYSFSDSNRRILDSFKKIVQMEESNFGWYQPELLGARPSFLFNIEDSLIEQVKRDTANPRYQFDYTDSDYLEAHRKGRTPKKFLPKNKKSPRSETLRRQLLFNENRENVPPRNFCQALQGLEVFPNGLQRSPQSICSWNGMELDYSSDFSRQQTYVSASLALRNRITTTNLANNVNGDEMVSGTTFLMCNQLGARNSPIFNDQQSNLPAIMRNHESCFNDYGQQRLYSLFPREVYNSASPYPLQERCSSPGYNTMHFTFAGNNVPKSNKIYLLIKAAEKKNVDIGQTTHKWVFSPPTEKKVIGYAKEGKDIYLIFHVKEFGYVGGIAKYVSMCYWNTCGKPTAMIQWIYTELLQDQRVRHLSNPCNSGRPIYEGLDGTVIENDVAEELFRIYSECRR